MSGNVQTGINIGHSCLRGAVIRCMNAISPLTLLIVLVTWFWWPSLWQGEVIIHADSAHHGWTLLSVLHNWILGEADLLWDSGIYGGHPVFAESQGGYLNPTNLLSALLFKPEHGVGVLHWLNMLVAGVGLYVLCRQLDIDRWAAAFGATVCTFSTIWISIQYNISVSGTLAWLPWLLVACEFWLRQPGVARALWIPLPATLMLFSGYPHLVHGAAIYLLVYGSSLLITKGGRLMVLPHVWKIISGMALALILTVLLSAVQLMPILELIQYSHRRDGVALPFGGATPVSSYIRGFLFWAWPIKPIQEMGSLGILAAAIFSVIGLLAKPSPRILAHACAAFALINLGVEFASPIFRFVYNNNLVPGLHNYRIMHPFLLVAVVGVSVVSARGLSVITDCVKSQRLQYFIMSKVSILAIGIVILIAGLYVWMGENSDTYRSDCLLVIVMSISSYLLILLTKEKFIAPASFLTLIVYVLITRDEVFRFFPAEKLNPSEEVNLILSDLDQVNYRSMINNPYAPGFVFMAANSAELEAGYRYMINNLIPHPAALWGIKSIDGSMGLALSRRRILDPVFQNELEGKSNVPPGARAIDVLGIRYVSMLGQASAPGLHGVTENIYKNDYALPLIRSYQSAVVADSTEEAVGLLSAGKAGDKLIVETEAAFSDSTSRCGEISRANLKVIENRSEYYKVEIKSECAGWLFIADAFYPGWQAKVNGVSVELYPAQVLGKALKYPPGDSVVEVLYRPNSFRIGLFVSTGGLILWCGLFSLRLRRNKPRVALGR
ncbi:hypothetical protein SAMN05216296_3217 [Pseudomonas pohangensis]|uniref:Membrane protein YfhO n=1 Tax=Pseudomonas pohangensis TaxID=364197 RepID=A0A1H2HRY5_9PSED|nr:hypothetical protein [Pseudomonas pohangensis]SDU34565.1 hypothetical protein SAMN05216296_3217 [Pseudomonas pohangensis]